MTVSLLAATQSVLLPGDCVLTGLCLTAQPPAGPAPGLLFLASGLVLLGILGLRPGQRGRGAEG